MRLREMASLCSCDIRRDPKSSLNCKNVPRVLVSPMKLRIEIWLSTICLCSYGCMQERDTTKTAFIKQDESKYALRKLEGIIIPKMFIMKCKISESLIKYLHEHFWDQRFWNWEYITMCAVAICFSWKFPSSSVDSSHCKTSVIQLKKIVKTDTIRVVALKETATAACTELIATIWKTEPFSES